MTINNNYEKYSGTVKLFFNFGEHKISDGFHSNDRNYGVNIYEAARLFKGNNLTVGADYLIYGGKAENEIYNSFITDTTVRDAGLYLFVQQQIFEGFSVNSGIRLQDHSVYGKRLIPAGGFAWRIGSQTTWKSSVARGFRSPTIRELFIWNHNVKLNPETIMNYETGITQTIPAIRLKLELTGFAVTGNNMIITVPMKGLQNAGKVSNTGIEFAASAKPSENLFIDLTYSYIRMKYPVYATPRHNLFGSTSYNFRKFRFALSAQYIDHLDTDPLPGKESYQTYLLIDSKVSFNLQKWCELFVSGENLLNQEYENNIYYPMPGITFFGGMKLKFQ
jgi:iron complex outermembrane receptor protein